MTMIDDTDRALIEQLQRDAGQSYAALGTEVGLSAGSAHSRVRKLRELGVIRRTTIEVDPAAIGRGVLAFVTLTASEWMGDTETKAALAELTEIEEAHVVAGSASILLKVRTSTTEQLQSTLRRLFQIPGVSGTETIVALETCFERSTTPA